MPKTRIIVAGDGCIAEFMLYELLERDLGVSVTSFAVAEPEHFTKDAEDQPDPSCIVILDTRGTDLPAVVTAWRTITNVPIIVVTGGTYDDFSGFRDVEHLDQDFDCPDRSYDALLGLIRVHVGRSTTREAPEA